MPTATAYIEALPVATEQSRKLRYVTSVPSLFSVVSWGCAGTAWLARALNSHPDIFCVHGANHYLQSMRGIAPMDGLDYLHVIAAMATGHNAVGDVHGISRHLIPELRENYGPIFASAVLVRDPLPRIKSQLALFKTMPETTKWDLSYLDPIAEQLEMPPASISHGDRLRLHAFNMLNSITEERSVGPIFRIEDLVGQQDPMDELLTHLTSGRLHSPGWWLDYVQQLPVLNAHRAGDRSSGLSPADLHLLSQVVTAESKELYRELGYFLGE